MSPVIVQPGCATWGCNGKRETRLWCRNCYRKWMYSESIYQCPSCKKKYDGRQKECVNIISFACGSDDCDGHWVTCSVECVKIGSHMIPWTKTDLKLVLSGGKLPECSEDGCRGVAKKLGLCIRCYNRKRHRNDEYKASAREWDRKWRHSERGKTARQEWLQTESARKSIKKSQKKYKDKPEVKARQKKQREKYYSKPEVRRRRNLRDRARRLRVKGVTRRSVTLLA